MKINQGECVERGLGIRLEHMQRLFGPCDRGDVRSLLRLLLDAGPPADSNKLHVMPKKNPVVLFACCRPCYRGKQTPTQSCVKSHPRRPSRGNFCLSFVTNVMNVSVKIKGSVMMPRMNETV